MDRQLEPTGAVIALSSIVSLDEEEREAAARAEVAAALAATGGEEEAAVAALAWDPEGGAVTVGTFGEATSIVLAERASIRRVVAPDRAWLRRSFEGTEEAAERLLRVNSELVSVGGRHRLALAGELLEVEGTVSLDRALAFADAGVTATELARALVAADPELTLAEAEAFVAELVAARLLRPAETRAPELDGAGLPPRLAVAARAAERAAAAPSRETIARFTDELAAAAPELPAAAVTIVRRREGTVTASVELGQAVARGAEILLRVRAAADPLDGILRALLARLGDAEVPLLEALDGELGAGFDLAPPDRLGPLLAGLPFAGAPPPLAPSDRALLTLLPSSEGAPLRLDEATLDALSIAPRPPPPALWATVSPASDRVILERLDGPCELPGLVALARLEPRLGEAHRGADDARLAEVTATGLRARDGTVLLPRDLTLRVADEQLLLRAPRLALDVVPARGVRFVPDRGDSPSVRFLWALAGRGAPRGLCWSWGALEALSRLPAVEGGGLVLARARHRLIEAEVERFDAHGLRADRGLPRRLLLQARGRALPIDLDRPSSVALLEAELRRGARVLEELLPGEAVASPEGPVACRLVIPLRAIAPPPLASSSRAGPTRSEARRLLGTDWTVVKLYATPLGADGVLRDLVGPWAAGEPAIRSLHFLRYTDGRDHVRVVVAGALPALLPGLLQRAEDLFARCRLADLGLASYDRPVQRFGGVDGVAIAEELFAADSAMVLELLAAGALDDDDQRWRLALLALDRLLADLFPTASERSAALRLARGQFRDRLRAGPPLVDEIARRFVARQDELAALLSSPRPLAIDRRSARLAPLIAALRQLESAGKLERPLLDTAPSYLHLAANRLLRSATVEQELVLYEWLARLHGVA